MTRLHPDEVSVDESVVSQLLASQFPQWSGLPLERVNSTGTVNVIYRLGDELCLRLPRRAAWVESLSREVEWLPRLASAAAPLRVPAPVATGTPGEGFPLPWGVFRWIEGETADSGRLHGSERAPAELAGFITRLGRLDTSGSPKAHRRESLAARDEVTREAMRDTAHRFDSSLLTAAWEASLAAPEWDRVPRWIHGDLLPANLLVRDGELAAVLDFGGAGSGDPAADMLPAWSVFTPEQRQAFRDALDVDEGTWIRGRGWALSVALLIIPYYELTNPAFTEMACGMVSAVLEDFDRAP